MSADILIKIDNLKKTFKGGLEALKGVNLEIQRGEILALLGPNGAGKTTLINAICGIVLPTSGNISVDGYDVVKDYRKTRSMIGVVPQELHLEAFEKVFQILFPKMSEKNLNLLVLNQLILCPEEER